MKVLRQGELGGDHLPFSPINRGRGAKENGPTFFMHCNTLKINERRERREKNPSQGASVMLLRHFRERFRGSSSPFFIILRSSTDFS